MYQRRGLLKLGATAALGMLGGLAAEAARAGETRRADERAWAALKTGLSPQATLYRPGVAGYETARKPWNGRYADVYPDGVVRCATTQDVQLAVRWAKDNGVPLAARSGGHNYAGYSTTNGLVVDIRRIRSVVPGTHRSGTPTLTLGGGCTNSDVYDKRKYNLYFPGGRCGGVGVAGLALGGGLGFNDRKWGMTCDRMLRTEVVLADGNVVRCDASNLEDLFWACRGGGGGNFGINTGFVFESVDVGEMMSTVFDITLRLEHAPKVIAAVQGILHDDRNNNFDIRVGFINPGKRDQRPRTWLLGHYLGPEKELRKHLAPILALRPSKQEIGEHSFWAGQDKLLEPPSPETLASKSLVPKEWLTPSAVQIMADSIADWQPAAEGNAGFVTLFAMGGVIDSTRPWETAYVHRGAKFVIDIGTVWHGKEEVGRQARARQAATYAKLAAELKTTAAYVNFPDPDLPQWWSAYYGGNYNALLDVKRRYDLHRVFHYTQGIGANL
ncbi:FAD-dependent oxidoreductase [Allorhizocola rhizosphaerae]|uniref:FAD-dependent oxidoreductase n=1 Tax=Allorhizocola rhizosphaerae TaxID=1872709 RepID=UPI000E3E94E6|nr:FAD-binding protein [Allorhizocola rhizosphaerae]